MKTHQVNEYDIRYTGRTSWKANIYRKGELVFGEAPVTWTKGTRPDTLDGGMFQEVWFRNRDDMLRHNELPEPFVVAIARAEDYAVMPHKFAEFVTIYEVMPTGRILNDDDAYSIETKVTDIVSSRRPTNPRKSRRGRGSY